MKLSRMLIDCNELFSRGARVKRLIFQINKPTRESDEVRSLDLQLMNERREESSDSGPTRLAASCCRWAGN